MNISELYFLKAFPCKRTFCENQNFCYFHHKQETDKRRLLLDFVSFFNANKNLNSTNSQIFKANQLKSEMNVYSDENHISDLLRDFCVKAISNCANMWEKAFHILNYFEKKCKFGEKGFSIECPNKLFCADFHCFDYEKSGIAAKSQYNKLPFYRELGNKSLIKIIFNKSFYNFLQLFFTLNLTY